MQFSVVAILAAGLAAAAPQQTIGRGVVQPTPTSGLPAGATCSVGPVVDYTVVPDDTLTTISQKMKSGICNIAKASKLENPNFIQVGQVLKVPTNPCPLDNVSCLAKPSENNPCVKGGQPTYTIAKGDTFFLVAQKFNLDVNALTKVNQGVDPLLLEVGQTIKVPVC
nr:secretory protein [Falciphora oryzae]